MRNETFFAVKSKLKRGGALLVNIFTINNLLSKTIGILYCFLYHFLSSQHIMYVWVEIITDRDDVRLTLTLAPRQVKEKEKNRRKF